MSHLCQGMPRLALTLACLYGAAGVVTGQEQATPMFRAGVEYVEVDAVVTDHAGAFVDNLVKGDFEVFEDGKRQEISSLSVINIPVERRDAPTTLPRVEPDVVTNENSLSGRVYVMVLDDLRVAGSRGGRVQETAKAFIEKYLGPDDRMAIVFSGGVSKNSQELTGSKTLLLDAVKRFTGQRLESVTANMAATRPLDNAEPNERDVLQCERSQRTQALAKTLGSLSDWLGAIRGRKKTLLLVSEGPESLPMDLRESCAIGTDDFRGAINAAKRANVTLYAIDPRGLTTFAEDAIDIRGANRFDARALRGEGLGSQNIMANMAEETGGRAYANRNSLADAFSQIVQENSAYYVLAYVPPSDKRDGKFHNIDVKVNRPGVSVRSRAGYAAHDELAFFAEIYDNDRKNPQHLTITTRVVSADDGREVFSDAQQLDMKQKPSDARTHAARIPLSDMASGAYLLQLEVMSSREPDKRVVRRVPFTIAP